LTKLNHIKMQNFCIQKWEYQGKKNEKTYYILRKDIFNTHKWQKGYSPEYMMNFKISINKRLFKKIRDKGKIVSGE
jgi:hypothetical protein